MPFPGVVELMLKMVDGQVVHISKTTLMEDVASEDVDVVDFVGRLEKDTPASPTPDVEGEETRRTFFSR